MPIPQVKISKTNAILQPVIRLTDLHPILLYLASINLHPDNTFNSCNSLLNRRQMKVIPFSCI